MGLDIQLVKSQTIGRAGSYGGFNDFRKEIANHEGFTLSDMMGFGGTRLWADVDTTLTPLLTHSDCDGKLYSEECAEMLPRLEAIINEAQKEAEEIQARMDKADAPLQSDEDELTKLEWFIDRCGFWVDAMQTAVDEHGALEFV